MKAKGLERYPASQSFVVSGLLAVVGGYLDAYTYICRGHVFADAHTGNAAFLAFYLVQGNWLTVVRYSVVIAAFLVGVFASQIVEHRIHPKCALHWRQIVVLLQFLLLVTVSFVPRGDVLDILVNAAVSFVCALQLEAFQDVRGVKAAATMCVGNLRGGTEHLCYYFRTKEKASLVHSLHYYGIFLLFFGGVVLGGALTNAVRQWSPLFCCVLLAVVFLLLFAEKKKQKQLQ